MAEGLSRRDVAAAAGRSEGAVRIQCHKLGLKFCPIARARRSREGVQAVWRTPEYRAKVSAGVRAAYTEEHRATLSARCHRLRLWERGQAVLATDPEAAQRRADKARVNMAKHRRDALAWCPEPYRDTYRANAAKLRNAAEAKRVTLDQIAADAARQLQEDAARNGWPASFVDLLRRVRSGEAKLVERQWPSAKDHDFSLTGCSADIT
jgi:hypothetical protein